MTAVHHLCEELRLARVKRGMSLRQMGSALGLTGDSRGVVILRWETGKTMPRVDSLARWAAALGHDIVLRARATGEPPALTAPVDLMAALRASFERIKAVREADTAEQAHDDLQAELAEDARREYAAERDAE